jgi:hypothetical protein
MLDPLCHGLTFFTIPLKTIPANQPIPLDSIFSANSSRTRCLSPAAATTSSAARWLPRFISERSLSSPSSESQVVADYYVAGIGLTGIISFDVACTILISIVLNRKVRG